MCWEFKSFSYVLLVVVFWYCFAALFGFGGSRFGVSVLALEFSVSMIDQVGGVSLFGVSVLLVFLDLGAEVVDVVDLRGCLYRAMLCAVA